MRLHFGSILRDGPAVLALVAVVVDQIRQLEPSQATHVPGGWRVLACPLEASVAYGTELAIALSQLPCAHCRKNSKGSGHAIMM
jgi:hypothetical protein